MAQRSFKCSTNSVSYIKRRKYLQKDFSNLLLSAKGSAQLVASITSKVSWRRLWDIALEKGVKGTKIVQSLFREVCRPASCFKCSVCDSHVPSTTTCFEHACNKHPEQVQKLSVESLVDMLSEGQADSMFLFVLSCLTVNLCGNYNLNNSQCVLQVFLLFVHVP